MPDRTATLDFGDQNKTEAVSKSPPSAAALRTRKWRAAKRAASQNAAHHITETNAVTNSVTEHHTKNGDASQKTVTPCDAGPPLPVAYDRLSNSDFKWDHERYVVQQECSSVAVYLDPKGFLIIRRGPYWNEEDDAIIPIASCCQAAFAERVFELLKDEVQLELLDRFCDMCGVPSFP
jgi:hypothetical protein